jgi:hypothetical protein
MGATNTFGIAGGRHASSRHRLRRRAAEGLTRLLDGVDVVEKIVIEERGGVGPLGADIAERVCRNVSSLKRCKRRRTPAF